MPKYSTALGGGLAGIMKGMMSGKQGAKIGADTATKDAYMLSQMGNLDASGQTKLAKAAADTFRTDAQSALFNDPTRRTERALEMNGVLGGDAQQIQQIIADPKLMETFGDELGMSRDQLSRIQRTRGMLANQYELTGDTNADQFTQGLNTALERGDFENVLARPETALAMNVAQAAKDGKLFDAVGDTGMTLNAGTGAQVIGNAPVYQAGLGKTQSEIRENNAQASKAINQEEKPDALDLKERAQIEQSYRKEFNSLNTAYNEIKRSRGNIISSLGQNTAAGDLAAATSLMKMLDPGSVVRESELGMAQNATGALDRIYNYAQMLSNGQRLNPQQRKEYVLLSNDLFANADKEYQGRRNEFARVSKDYGLKAENIIGSAAISLPSQPAKIRSIPAATDWLSRQNIQTQDQARKAVADLTAKGWTRDEIERAFDGAGL